MSAARPRLAELPAHFDLIVIGGGITGAGVAAEAARGGVRVLLVDQDDFASGTSGASSKLVHGGLRYLAGGHWRLTLESVRERNRLLRERPELVEPQAFLMPVYRGMRPGRGALRAGLAVYDLMGGAWKSRALSAAQALALEPGIRRENLLGAVAYDDARTDDARLTLSLIFEARAAGAVVLNYARAAGLLYRGPRVAGVAVEDRSEPAAREITADVVVNAAGPRAAQLPMAPEGAPALRPLRGSHLIFPRARLPVQRAVSWMHPRDGRPIFVYPWLGAVLYGTTDVDDDAAELPSRISRTEADYLQEGLAHQFPESAPRAADALSSYAGVRPIVAGGKANPSAESRESALWTSPGYVGITGGKLTTFRVTARQVLRAAARQAPSCALRGPESAPAALHPLAVRHGAAFPQWFENCDAQDRATVAASPYVWAELRWSLRHEQVLHLDDLLLRRTRLGLLLPQGATEVMESVGALCRAELGWSEAHWDEERMRYLRIWQQRHSPPA